MCPSEVCAPRQQVDCLEASDDAHSPPANFLFCRKLFQESTRKHGKQVDHSCRALGWLSLAPIAPLQALQKHNQLPSDHGRYRQTHRIQVVQLGAQEAL